MNLLVRCSCILQAALCLCISAVADNEWPQFRGPDGQGHASTTGLPTTWSETENIVWKSAVPGEGHSSPVISGDQIWLTTAITKELTAEEDNDGSTDGTDAVVAQYGSRVTYIKLTPDQVEAQKRFGFTSDNIKVRSKLGTLFSNHGITIPQLMFLKVSNEIQLESDLTFVKN